jgi:hypothetical protein
VEERRERLGNVVKELVAALLLALELLPAPLDRARRVELGVAEDVRVAPDELLVDPLGDGGEVAGALLVEQKGEEIRLEEEVAELVEELVVVAGHGRVRDLVRLLDRVRNDGLRRLAPVPRALAAEPLGQLLESEERVGEVAPGDHGASYSPVVAVVPSSSSFGGA